MKNCIEYLQERPNRWVTVERKQDQGQPNTYYYEFEGWLRGADEVGVVIFGRAVTPPISRLDPSLPQFREDSHFIAWDQIAAIHFDQDRED